MFLLLAFVLGACSTAVSPTSTLTPPATETPSATDIPNTPTPSPSPTATQTSWPISRIPPCTKMNALESIPDDYQISGRLLSINMPAGSSSGWISMSYVESRLLNFNLLTRIETDMLNAADYQDAMKTKIQFLYVGELNASPDFLNAVYRVDAYDADYVPKKSWLEIYHANTGEITRIPWKKDWAYIIGWINADYFGIRAGGSTLFLDSTGDVKKSIHTSNYPDYSNPRAYKNNAHVLWGGYKLFDSYALKNAWSAIESKIEILNPTLEVYSPSINHVIYTEVKNNKPGVVLYNIETQSKVIEIITGDEITFYAYGGAPVWSQKGDQALMLLPETENPPHQFLSLLDVSGKVERLTDFQIIGPYSWSPDGNFVAFWLNNGDQIGILDMKAKTLNTFCMNAVYSNHIDTLTSDYEIATGNDLVWLPNNKQLLFETENAKIVIVDLEKHSFSYLKWDAISPVWLKE
jgi:hypothetical protein